MLSLALHNRMRSAGQNSKSPATESDSESESENLMEHNVPVADLLHLDSPKKKTKKTKKVMITFNRSVQGNFSAPSAQGRCEPCKATRSVCAVLV